MQAPQRRKAIGWHRITEGVGGPAQSGGSLIEIVLEQPRLGERGPQGQFFPAGQGGGSKDRRQ